MNLLSVGVGFGVIVAVFQWGWAKGLFGVAQAGPVESIFPIILFAILFGLTMDYEIFLVSRIREEYVRTGDPSLAVTRGLGEAGRVIAAAAAIMVAVFLAFVLSPDRVTKQFGLGLAIAILLDAALIRLVLVPAVMQLLGDRAWWLPSWLDRLLPHLNIEGTAAAHPAPAPAPAIAPVVPGRPGTAYRPPVSVPAATDHD